MVTMLGRQLAVLVVTDFTALTSWCLAFAEPTQNVRAAGTPSPPMHVPAPTTQPTTTTALPKQIGVVPLPHNDSTGQGPRVIHVTPASSAQRLETQSKPTRPRAVLRDVARRVRIAGGVLVLPIVAYYGVPVILDVPDLGYVELSEERYAELYDQLLSPDPEQVQAAIDSLREIKAAEDADVEAAQRRPVDTRTIAATPVLVERDLSELVSFAAPSRSSRTRRRADPPQRLY
jgi:hypothetical protein